MAKFSEVLNIINGKNQKGVENPDGAYPIYGSGGIIGYADDYLCGADTVIIGRKGSINNPIYAESPFWNVDTAFGLEANPEVLFPKYLYYFCLHFDFEQLNTMVTIPSLTKQNLLKIDIPLPSLEEQYQIAGKLDHITHVMDLCDTILEKLDLLIKSRFVEMFGDPMKSPRYTPMAIGKIGEVMTGTTPSMKKPEYYASNDILLIKPGDIAEKHVTTITSSQSHIAEAARSVGRIFPENSVLVTCIGNIGKVGLSTKESSCNQQINAVIPGNQVNYLYLAYGLCYRKKLLQESANTSVVPILNKADFSKITLPIPPMQLQEEFASFVRQADKAKTNIRQIRAKAETLKNSLMQKYFAV